MYRQILGYIPSNVIPAIISVLMIYAYTRLLSPAAFGSYSYVFSAVLILQTSLFYSLPIAVMRFFPGAALTGRRDGLLKEAYVIFYIMSLVVIVVGVAVGLIDDLPPQYALAAWLALPMLLFRSAVQLNQSVTRSGNQMARYNAVECGHAVLGFALSLVALFVFGHGPEAIVVGLLVAAIVYTLFDWRLMLSPFRRTAGALNGQELSRLIGYSWPLVAVAATAVVLQTGDRFLLGSLAGAEVLGIFAVAYNLVDRPMTLICSAISTATFPLVVQVFEQQGREAARIQAGRNGIALLAVCLPACVGLALTADYITAFLVGAEFRSGVALLLPVMSFAALARGFRAHFIDHVFHLSGQPLLMLWTYGPATIINIALNLYVIPRYGMTGAAWTSLVCQLGTVLVGWFLGNALFPVWLPSGQVVRCVLAVVPMALVLWYVRFPLDLMGLLSAVVLGMVCYGVAALALNVGDVRTVCRGVLVRRLRGKHPALME